jgi:hypothetical protein
MLALMALPIGSFFVAAAIGAVAFTLVALVVGLIAPKVLRELGVPNEDVGSDVLGMQFMYVIFGVVFFLALGASGPRAGASGDELVADLVLQAVFTAVLSYTTVRLMTFDVKDTLKRGAEDSGTQEG